MKTLLYVAKQVKLGRLSLAGAVKVTTSRQEVEAIGKNGHYVDYVCVDSERMGDGYSFELTNEEYDVQEVLDYLSSGQYELDLDAYEVERRNAVSRIAELVASVQPNLEELITLANKFDIPANIKVNGSTNDFRLIDAVDWDSSSMYC